jgi:uncharacterized protein (DUF1501 family)
MTLNTPLPRRQFLAQAGLAAGLLAVPGIAFAASGAGAGARRFVFVIQRGAADGLNTLIPYADPAYAKLRGPLAIDPATAIKLDGMFALHPSLVEIGKMYGTGQAAFVHAIASPYRDRSHFDGQNVLETGGTAPYATKDGWLNRLAGMIPKRKDQAIAFAPTVPMALRGPTEVTSYAASGLPQPADDLLMRVEQLYSGDAQLHGLWMSAMQARGMAEGNSPRQDPASVGKMAATFLSKPEGPRIAMIETNGWDTHSGQAGRLAAQLRNLDTMIAALRAGMGPAWSDTVVLVATEFGRTAAANGTGGTDHGTGAAAMLAGGAVKGGRVIADWPGLGNGALYEGRDLKPTTSLDGLIAGVAGECFGLDGALVRRTLFPELTGKAMSGLVTV